MKLAIALVCFAAAQALAQGPGGVPHLSADQAAGLAVMNQMVAPMTQAVAAARNELAAATYATPLSAADIQTRTAALKLAELGLAGARAEAFAQLQSGPGKLAADQVQALAAQNGGAGGRAGGRGATPQYWTQRQQQALAGMSAELAGMMERESAARAELTAAALVMPRNDGAIRAKAEALGAVEGELAKARAVAFGKVQGSAGRLGATEVAALAGMGGGLPGGRGGGLGFTMPEPIDFGEHEGYVSLFDGVSLQGWDGSPKFWRAEGGAIVGESTPQNPSGNTYIAYRGLEAKDFTLKFEIKVEGTGGSGLQYRSKTGIPWLSAIPANVTANVGPVNLNWMMTGPQADFWPSARDWTGQFYSENTPMRIMAWRGQVVEGAGLGTKRLMGTIGDRAELNHFVKMNDWNEYTVIARGGVFIHILNGQLMAVMVDDDPASSNNQAGLFGIELEAVTKVSVRNIWLKKLN